mmetsp:Transcript_1963/g.4421  ORF Transcript_1963/g.4421 Transcript_1963/m.4421 type:complete len:264 (+) Transcript_1963:366-1157(+)
MTPVHTCTVSAPMSRNSAASFPVSTPPMPLSERPGYSSRIIFAKLMHLARAMGRTAAAEYPPGVLYPSTEGSGRSVFRLIPMTDMMVLIAASPSMPLSSETRPGEVMLMSFGVIFAHTGIVEASAIHLVTSCSSSQSCPMAAPMRRSGMPCGQLKLISSASTPVSMVRPMSSSQRSLLYSSISEAMRTRSGYSSLSCLSSASMTSVGRSEMSSMFCQPSTCLLSCALSFAYRGVTLCTAPASSEMVLQMTPPHPSSNAFFMTA